MKVTLLAFVLLFKRRISVCKKSHVSVKSHTACICLAFQMKNVCEKPQVSAQVCIAMAALTVAAAALCTQLYFVFCILYVVKTTVFCAHNYINTQYFYMRL